MASVHSLKQTHKKIWDNAKYLIWRETIDSLWLT